MRAFVQQSYQRISASYWFVPTVMALLAAILALGLVQADLYIPPTAFGSSPFLFAAQPDGARAILSSIGGSMIGVAGTVFSITMATVVFASGTFGPRLLTNFMNNRGNQITLGTFVATFVYTMIVLRSVRDGATGDTFASMFVPNLAVYGAIGLAICSIGILIFFIHHVPSNIHISNVIADIGQKLVDDVHRRFPKKLGAAPDDDGRGSLCEQIPPCFRADASNNAVEPAYGEVETRKSGYIQVLDYATLVTTARKHDLIVRMNCRPGTFAHPGQVMFDVWPTDSLSDEAREGLISSIALGNTRNVTQDLLFLFDELVEIAARALSPGTNDPFTAVTCMDWLAAAFSQMAGDKLTDPLRVDEDGTLRVIGEPLSFAEFLEHAFGHLRQYAADDMIAGEHFIEVLGQIAPSCRRSSEFEALRHQRSALLELARKNLAGQSLATIEAAAARFDDRLNHPRLRSRIDVQKPLPAPEAS
ncbi:DUF2254 domain-containing protein [Fulvimarina sp. MAC8]|uniref:DUF2254 domain-containing protein n=1 Tax=Fulvimarina sp. MAC8 TaxID=3162874 RepID=UPI0032EBEEDA